ncbi:MAG TPA: isoprenylcysteine carboxylmethyltransferase family protein [Mycobacterium sp.]|nr:isoprenylcysteine carboxylmethyltransferase family protein [Mycobacterium sp.]HUH69191.1 isoprenylcysteine carboxylmethyltransferase family protein [Mycobacterium sp.]
MGIAGRATVQSVIALLAFGVLLFVPAGTLHYWQAWVFLAVFTIASLYSAVYLFRKNPAVVERRMHAGPKAETRPVQKVVAAGISILFVALLVFSALDHRFGWSPVPPALSLIGDALVAIGLGIAILTVSQNSYAAANITVEESQTVTSTGLYGIVRHPMYMGASIMFVGIPLALDSCWGLAVLVPVVIVLAVRIADEEKLLNQELAGYREYAGKVHYRLVPYVW